MTCPTCEHQRHIANQALIELLDRDAQIQDLNIRISELESEVKGYREQYGGTH